MLVKLKGLFNLLIYGGSTKFNDVENDILSAVSDALPENEKIIFKEQRDSVKLVQRQHPGRLIMAYYGKNTHVTKLPYPGYEHCLAEIKYKNKNKTKKTSVILHNGVLQSIERNVPKEISELESIVSVTLHPQGFKSIAEEIDTEEHGNIT